MWAPYSACPEMASTVFEGIIKSLFLHLSTPALASRFPSNPLLVSSADLLSAVCRSCRSDNSYHLLGY